MTDDELIQLSRPGNVSVSGIHADVIAVWTGEEWKSLRSIPPEVIVDIYIDEFGCVNTTIKKDDKND